MGTQTNRPQWAARVVGGLLAAAALGGCKQQLFLEPADYKEAIRAGIPGKLETDPRDAISPSIVTPGPGPATVLDPSRPPRYISLKECIAIAVERGNIGIQGGIQGGTVNAGFANDNLTTFTGQAVTGTDNLRALVLDPAVVGANIERALSKFDARWTTSMSWSKQDQATLSLQQSFSNGDQAALNSTLAKPLPTGGLAGITFSVNYLKLATPPLQQNFVTLATSYSPRLQFIFEQPLLQQFGVEVNQLATSLPSSLLIPGLRPSGGTTVEGILITRIRYDQQRAEFDRLINFMLLNVEYAYWTLYASYYNLYAQEDVLRQSYELLSILQARLNAGTARQQDVSQTEAQYYRFRRAVVTAREQVLDSERQLRGLMGMRSDLTGDRLVPVDEPTLAPFHPDYYEVANEALGHRPELVQARHDVKYRQLDLILQKNLRRPDLRFYSYYDLNGLGSRLDGPLDAVTTNTTTGNPQLTPVNALKSLSSNQFQDWQLGLRLDMPLGFRDANAAVRQAQLNLYRSYYQLHDTERKTIELCTQQYRNLLNQYEQIRFARAERVELQRTLELYRTLIRGGQWDVNSLFNLLQVQQQAAAAITAEFQAIGSYNSSLAALEWSKGTIQQYNNVSIGEGPLPGFVGKKAEEHFRERANSIKVRERSNNPELPPLPPLGKPWEPILEKLPPNPTANVAPGTGGPASAPAPGGTTPAPQTLPAPKRLPNTPPTGMPASLIPSETDPTSVIPPGTPPVTPPAYQPGVPAPSAISPWPGSAGTPPSAPMPPAVPGGEAAANPTFTPIETVHLPRRAPAAPPAVPGDTPASPPPQ